MDLSGYPSLNLPKAQLQVRVCDDGVVRVHDPLRGKYVALTPEEWVRQHFVANLIDNLGYPRALMGNEVALTLNGTARRCDTVLFGADGLAPRMIVEYKAPHVEITQKVFDQIVRYNMVLRARWLAVSNGLRHFCCEVDYEHRTCRFLRNFPSYDDLKD